MAMFERKKVLTPLQSANLANLMHFEGLSRNVARYASLTSDQKTEFKEQEKAARVIRRQTDFRREMLLAKKRDARRRGIDFCITENDLQWPRLCPVTGIELRYDGTNGMGRRGPSRETAVIDRIDNTRGYLPGNVVIVSQWVNIRKGDATVEQLQLIANFYSCLVQPIGS